MLDSRKNVSKRGFSVILNVASVFKIKKVRTFHRLLGILLLNNLLSFYSNSCKIHLFTTFQYKVDALKYLRVIYSSNIDKKGVLCSGRRLYLQSPDHLLSFVFPFSFLKRVKQTFWIGKSFPSSNMNYKSHVRCFIASSTK